jgi:predicted RNA binding protein YcfA (HicA-like mRNA interferase family)
VKQIYQAYFRTMPRKIRQLIKDYKKHGFGIDVSSGKGSHRKISHPGMLRKITLSGADGADAKNYQEKELEKAIHQIKQT